MLIEINQDKVEKAIQKAAAAGEKNEYIEQESEIKAIVS